MATHTFVVSMVRFVHKFHIFHCIGFNPKKHSLPASSHQANVYTHAHLRQAVASHVLFFHKQSTNVFAVSLKHGQMVNLKENNRMRTILKLQNHRFGWWCLSVCVFFGVLFCVGVFVPPICANCNRLLDLPSILEYLSNSRSL